MSIRNLVLVFLAVMLTGGLVQSQETPQGVQLANDALTIQFQPPLMVDGKNYFAGVQYTYALLRGGTVHAVYASRFGSGDQLKGKYRIASDTLCTTFPVSQELGMPSSDEQCSHVYLLSDGSYQAWSISHDKLRATFRVRPVK